MTAFYLVQIKLKLVPEFRSHLYVQLCDLQAETLLGYLREKREGGGSRAGPGGTATSMAWEHVGRATKLRAWLGNAALIW